ncbi:MAG: hypothetical protein CSA65_03410 [Proteobacteria bacterium]|nr:MAG: hypothetical protein CSA65_03410 [Pseudomonadota bacterium]
MKGAVLDALVADGFALHDTGSLPDNAIRPDAQTDTASDALGDAFASDVGDAGAADAQDAGAGGGHDGCVVSDGSPSAGDSG